MCVNGQTEEGLSNKLRLTGLTGCDVGIVAGLMVGSVEQASPVCLHKIFLNVVQVSTGWLSESHN